jgi:phosphate uptake regulator
MSPAWSTRGRRSPPVRGTRSVHSDGQIDVETAVDIALVGRYYERFADHAVMVGARVAFAPGVRSCPARFSVVPVVT